MEEKLLVTVDESVELFLYEGILKQNKIPYLVKQKNIGNYLKILAGSAGHSTPADIYVTESDYEKAVEITEVMRSEQNQGPDNKDNPMYKRKNMFAWIIVSLFLTMIVVALVTGAFKG